MYFCLRKLMRDHRFHADLPPDVQEHMIEQTYELVGDGNMRVVPKHLQKGARPMQPRRARINLPQRRPQERWQRQQGAAGTG